MQYMFVPGHVGCKKQFLLHTNSGAIVSNFGTWNFRRLNPYVFFEFLGPKKLELEIFLTSDKMVFCRAWGPLSRRQTVPE